MKLDKACNALRQLALDGSIGDDFLKLAQASALLDGFDKENHHWDTGELIDGYANEKIDTVRMWFEMLCGVGEDGYTPDKIRENLLTDLGKLSMLIASDGLSLKRLGPPNEP